MAISGITRQYKKYISDDDKKSVLRSTPEVEKSDTSLIKLAPESFTGDTLTLNNNGRYTLPESIDVTSIKMGARSRGDYTPINSNTALITAFSPFSEVKTELNPQNTYIGLDKDGNFKVGTGDEFAPGDIASRTFSNTVYNFSHSDDGNYIWQKDSKHGNYSRSVPQIMVLDPNTNEKRPSYALNILSERGNPSGESYGNIAGGRVIVKVGDEIRLLSGSIQNIESEFEAMKKRNNTDHGEFYTLDNGSYNTALRLRGRNIGESDLRSYDAQNKSGGNFLYVTQNRQGGIIKRR